LPTELPEQTRLLLRKCLEKDRAKRISDIGIARFLLTETIAPSASAHTDAAGAKPRPLWQRVMPIAVTAAVAAIVGGAVASQWQRTEPPRVMRFTYQLANDQAFTNTGRPIVALSDDGTQMAFIANFGLHVRKMSELHAKLLVSGGSPTAQGPGSITTPAFSPDGRWIAFWVAGNASAGTIKKISTAGGAPVTICQATNPYGISWDGEDILFGQLGRGIVRVSASSDQPEVLVPKKENELGSPQLLPGGRHILYTAAAAADWSASSVVVHELGTPNAKTIIRNGVEGRYVPSGHIVYAQDGVLMATAFDTASMEVRGEAVPVVEGVRRSTAAAGIPTAHFSISDDGSLAYLPGPAKLNSELFDVALLDHKDAITPLNLPSNMYTFPRFSPDGRYLAVGVESATPADIWIYDLSGTSSLRRLTFGGNNRLPVWSGDSRRVAFQSDREGDLAIFWQPADGTGTAERLTKPEKGTVHWPYDLSPSGDTMLFGIQQNPAYSVWTLSLKDKKVQRFGGGVSSYGALSATFSPDGKWVAYSSNPAAGSLIFVQPFPATGAVYQVGQGINPFWSGDGQYLYYSPGPTGFFHQVAVQTKPAFSVSNPVSVPRTRAFLRLGYPANYDIAPNNQRFAIVINRAPTTTTRPAIEIVLNWFEELKQRVPSNRD
jgi:serine/threonine-protein kinase